MKQLTKNLFKNTRAVFLNFYVFIFLLPCSALARDFLSSVENASQQIRQIIAVVGVLALMIGEFVFTGQKNLEWKNSPLPLSELWSLLLLPQSSRFSIRLLTKRRKVENI